MQMKQETKGLTSILGVFFLFGYIVSLFVFMCCRTTYKVIYVFGLTVIRILHIISV